jgi:hypothetical protein
VPQKPARGQFRKRLKKNNIANFIYPILTFAARHWWQLLRIRTGSVAPKDMIGAACLRHKKAPRRPALCSKWRKRGERQVEPTLANAARCTNVRYHEIFQKPPTTA